MKFRLLFVLLACTAAALGQYSPSQIRSVSTLPTTCNAGGGDGGSLADHVDLWFGGVNVPYYCSAPNTWSAASGTPLWSGLTNPNTNLSLNLGANTTTFTSGDYGASPAPAVQLHTTTSTSSTDTSYEWGCDVPATSYHNCMYAKIDGFMQFQVCSTDGSQHVGIILMGSAIPCNNLSISPISKNWLTAQTPAHTVDTLFHSATNENGTLFQMHSASAAGVNFDFARACTGASTADGSCPSGNNQWRVHSDGSTYQNGSGNFGATPPTALPAGSNGTAFSESSTAGTPTAGQDYCRGDSTNHQQMCSDNGGAEYARQPLPPRIVGTGVTRWGSGDIGSQINNAIGGACVDVQVMPGSYSQTSTIIKPRCGKVRAVAPLATTLTWTGATTCTTVGPVVGCPWAVIINDSSSTTSYPEGAIEDISLVGPGTGSVVGGIFIGGDVTGGGIGGPGVTLAPAANYGDHQNINRVNISGFGTGEEWGRNAWSTSTFESVITSNGTNVYFPSWSLGITNSGESLRFTDTSIQNATVMGVNQSGFSDMYFNGGSCDYNIGSGCGLFSGAHFYGMHFEQSSGVILTVGGTTQPHVEIFGGEMLQTLNSGTDADMIYVNSTLNPSLIVEGTYVSTNHTLTNFVNWNGSGGNPLLDISKLPYHPTWSSVTNATCNFWGCNIDDPSTGFHVQNSQNYSVSSAGFVSSNGGFSGPTWNLGGPFGSGTAQTFSSCETAAAPTTLSVGGTTTDTGINCLPANSIIDAVTYRITTTITTAASFTIGDASGATRFCGAQSTLTSGTTGTCLAQYGTGTQVQTAAAKVRVTTNVNPGAGAIRLIVYYHTWTPPTS